MESIPGAPIRTVDDVVRAHVEGVLATYAGKVPQYRIALELGWSPTTLIRRLKEWARDEGGRERR